MATDDIKTVFMKDGYTFWIDLSLSDSSPGKLYCRTQDVYLERDDTKDIWQDGVWYRYYMHPWAGDYYLKPDTNEIYTAKLTLIKAQELL